VRARNVWNALITLALLTACNAGQDDLPPPGADGGGLVNDGGATVDDGGMPTDDAGTPNDDAGTPNDGGTITCTPANLDFGTVAANVGTTLPVICTGDVAWSVVSLAGSLSVFTAQVDPSSSSSVAAGQAVEIDVTYTPTGTESDTGTVTMVSSLDGTPVTIATLTGNAILDENCYYSITPASMEWGEVTPDTTYTAAFTLTDVGPNECVIAGFSDTCGGDGGGPGPPVTSFRLSPPGGDGAYPTSITIPIELTCTQIGPVACYVQFSINNPTNPMISIPVAANCVGSALPDGGS
jgi:hypothetical protein